MGPAGNSRFRTQAAAGGKVSETFPGPSPLPSSCPSGRPGSPRQARAAPGELGSVAGSPHPPSSGPRHPQGHLSPQQAAGMKVRRSLGGVSIPRVFSSPGRASVFYLRRSSRLAGGGGRHESVSPSRDGWGPKLLVAAGEGHQTTGSPCLATPTSQVGAVSTSRKIKRLWKLLRVSAKLPPPSEKASVFEPASPKVQGKRGQSGTHLSTFHLLPVFNQEAFPFPFPVLPRR